MREKVKAIQKALQEYNIDGWLFCDFHNRDAIAHKILNIDEKKLSTRRWYYLIPADGQPVKIVHVIEKEYLSHLPGDTLIYSSWKELHKILNNSLKQCKKVAMQYSAYNNLPNISYVDAGTVELIKSFNVEVVSSANLVQLFLAKLSKEQILLHKKAGEKVQKIKDMAFEFIFDSIKSQKRITEYDVQQFILRKFNEENLTCESLHPIVAVNSHAANPHFQPIPENAFEIRKGDRILMDLWAKINVPEGVYYDITWCGYAGKNPPREYVKIFKIVVEARNLAKNFIIEKLEKGEKVCGWEVDDVVRKYITEKGYGKYFTHRTGHSIDTSVHGSGVNLDNFETKDEREIIPGICFSIEPGIYKGNIGVRSEINMVIDYDKKPIVVGEEQEELVLPD